MQTNSDKSRTASELSSACYGDSNGGIGQSYPNGDVCLM